MECILCCEVHQQRGGGCFCCSYSYKDRPDIPSLHLVSPQHYSNSSSDSSSSSSSSSHFVCNVCLNSYLTVNILPKAFEVKASFAVIRCPSSGCSQVFHPLELYIIMDTNNKRRYQRILEELLCVISKRGGTHVAKKERTFVDAIGAGRRVNTALVDLLTLRCPTCRQAIDPFPDACAAVLCLCCGSYYCNCCLMAFCSGDSAVDKAECHRHTTTHHPNYVLQGQEQGQEQEQEQEQEQGQGQGQGLADPFLPHDVILAGHVNYRKMQITRVLKMVFLPPSSSSSSRMNRNSKSLHASLLNVLLLEHDLREQAGITLNYVMQLVQIRNRSDESFRSNDNIETTLPTSSTTVPTPTSISSSSSSSIGFRLMNCIYSSNVVAFKQLLGSLPNGSNDLNFRCPQTGLTLLALTSSFKLIECSLELLNKDCNVETLQGPCARSTLYVITEIGDLHLLHAIKIRFPSINLNQIATREQDSHRLIHVASRYGHGHIVEFLGRQEGIDVNVKEAEYGYTALHVACVYDQYFVTMMLLDIPSVNFMVYDDSGKLGIHIAAERGTIEIVRAYLQHAVKSPPLSIVDLTTLNEGWTSLHIAAHFKQPSIVKFLVDHGADVFLKDNILSYPPILFAILSGCIPSTMVLIEAMGKDVYTVKDALERTILHLACRENLLDVVSILQVQGSTSSLLQEDIERKLPIYYCIEAGSLATLSKLLSFPSASSSSSVGSEGIDYVNTICWKAEDKLWYPVHVAAALDRSDILFELIHVHKADWTVKDAHGKTASILAIEFNSSASQAVLLLFDSGFGGRRRIN